MQQPGLFKHVEAHRKAMIGWVKLKILNMPKDGSIASNSRAAQVCYTVHSGVRPAADLVMSARIDTFGVVRHKLVGMLALIKFLWQPVLHDDATYLGQAQHSVGNMAA